MCANGQRRWSEHRIRPTNPVECSPERIRPCHGETTEHPCCNGEQHTQHGKARKPAEQPLAGCQRGQ